MRTWTYLHLENLDNSYLLIRISRQLYLLCCTIPANSMSMSKSKSMSKSISDTSSKSKSKSNSYSYIYLLRI